MQFSPTDKIAIIGKSGCGKTTLSKKIHGSGLWPRVVLFDRMGEYDEKDFTHVARGFHQFSTRILAAHKLREFRLLFKFDIESDSKDAEFNEAMRVLYYAGDLCVVVEETWNFSTKNYLPKWYRETLLTGRHKGVGLITTSQRPAEVHKTIFSQSSHIFCGQSFETNDKKYLAEFIGDENSEKLSHLKKGDFLCYSGKKEGGIDIRIVNNRS